MLKEHIEKLQTERNKMDFSQDSGQYGRLPMYKHPKKALLQKDRYDSNEDSNTNSLESLLDWSANSLVSLPAEKMDSYMQAMCLALNNMENEPMDKQFSYFEHSLSQYDQFGETSTKSDNGCYTNTFPFGNPALEPSLQKGFIMKNPATVNSDMACSNFTSGPNRSAFQQTHTTLMLPLSSNTHGTANNVAISSQSSMGEYDSQGSSAKSYQNVNQSPLLHSSSQSNDNQLGCSQALDNNRVKGLSYSENRDNEERGTVSVDLKSDSRNHDIYKMPSQRALENFLSEDSPFAKKYGVNMTKLIFEKFKQHCGNQDLVKSAGQVCSSLDETQDTVSSSTNPQSHSQGMEYSDTSYTSTGGKLFDSTTLPDTSSSEKISSRKDRKWSLGTQNLCKVCGDKAAGYYCGAFVCEACKKFFMRASKQQKLKYCCIKDQNCVITKESRVQCQYCRYQKCLSLNMSCPDPSTMEKKGEGDISDIPCRVCGAPSSGFHFGALTCEGCKGFFRRMAKERETRHYQCSKNEACEITSMTRNLCKACRYKKCIEAGMSIEASRIGRQPNSVKHAISLELQHMGQNPKACNLNFKNLNDPSKQFDSSEHGEIQSTEMNDDIVRVKVEPSESSGSNHCRNTPPPTCSSGISPSLQCNENFEEKYQRMIDSVKSMNVELLNLIVRSEKSKPENNPLNFTDHRKCWAFMLIEFENHAACLIKFSKRITGFRKLSLDDQINLVQDSIYPIVILNQSRLFDLENKIIHYFNYTAWEHQKMLEYYPQLRELVNHFMHAGEIVKTVDFDDMEITFLSILLLLNPDREGLENKSFVEQLQVEFMEVLEDYEKRTYSNGYLRFGLLLLRLSEFHVFTVKHNIAVGVLLSEHPTLEMPQLYKEMFGAAVGGLFRKERNVNKFSANPIPDDIIQEELANNRAKMTV